MNIDTFYQGLQGMSEEKDIRKIEAFFLTSLEKADKEKDYSSYLTICNELIGFYQNASAFEQAFCAIEDMFLLMEELQLDNSEHFAAALLNAAAVYQNAGNSRQAYEYYGRVLNMSAQGGEVTPAQYCVALTGVGEYHYRNKDFAQSLQSYEKALQEMTKHFGDNASCIILCENCAAIAELSDDKEKQQYYLNLATEMKKKMESQ